MPPASSHNAEQLVMSAHVSKIETNILSVTLLKATEDFKAKHFNTSLAQSLFIQDCMLVTCLFGKPDSDPHMKLILLHKCISTKVTVNQSELLKLYFSFLSTHH